MVKNAWDYEHSSVPFRVKRIQDDALLSSYEPIENIDDYYEFLEDQSSEIKTIREKTRTGRPCGDKNFYSMIENLTGKNLIPKKSG